MPQLARTLILLIAFVAAPQFLWADSDGDTLRVSKAVKAALAKTQLADDEPGVAVSVVQPGKWHVMVGHGLANLESKAQITPKTVFEIASLTKPFTSMGILLLHQRQALSIHDDLRKHLLEFPEYDPARPIRIIDLLQHTSGVPEYMAFRKVPESLPGVLQNHDYLGEFARRKKTFPLQFRTGEKQEYCNTNYVLLALVIEKAAHRPFSEFMQEEILRPAGMKHSFFYNHPKAPPKDWSTEYNKTVGYTRQRSGEWKATWGLPPERHETVLTVGDGGLWTNLEDLSAWDQAVREHKLLTAETMALALTPPKTDDGVANTYALGWETYPAKKGKLNGFGHDGAWEGFKSEYYHSLLNNRTTIVLSNRKQFSTDRFWYVLDEEIEKALAE